MLTELHARREADGTTEAARSAAMQDGMPSVVRLGLCGPPGVGKSTLVESLGMLLTSRGRRVAVLAIDPARAPPPPAPRWRFAPTFRGEFRRSPRVARAARSPPC